MRLDGCDPQAGNLMGIAIPARARALRADGKCGATPSGIVDWLPTSADRIIEVGAGSGRLTLELIERGREVVAIEPATGLRQILERKLAKADHGYRARVTHGFFDDLPVVSDSADLVVACSVLTPAPGHGGDIGLAEMERVCRPGGCVAIIWPNNISWLATRIIGTAAGPMSVSSQPPRGRLSGRDLLSPGGH